MKKLKIFLNLISVYFLILMWAIGITSVELRYFVPVMILSILAWIRVSSRITFLD